MAAFSVITEYVISLAGRWLLLSALFCFAAQLLADDNKARARQLVQDMICVLHLPCGDVDQAGSGDGGAHEHQINNLDLAIDLAKSYWVVQLTPEMSDPRPRKNSQLLRFSESTFLATVFWYMISIESLENPHNNFLPEYIKDGLARQGATTADPVDEVVKLLSLMSSRRSDWLKGLKLKPERPDEKNKLRSFYRHYQLGYLSKYLFGGEYRAEPPNREYEAAYFCSIQELWINDPLSNGLNTGWFSLYQNRGSPEFQPFSAWITELYRTSHSKETALATLCRNYSGWLLYLMAIYDVIRNPENLVLQLAQTRKLEPIADEELYLKLVMGLAFTSEPNMKYYQWLLYYLAKDPLRVPKEGRQAKAAGLFAGRIAHYMHNMQSMHSGQHTVPDAALQTMQWITFGMGVARPTMFQYEFLNSADFSMLAAVRIVGAYHLLNNTEKKQNGLGDELEVFGVSAPQHFPLWPQYWNFQNMLLPDGQLLIRYLIKRECMDWETRELMQSTSDGNTAPVGDALTLEPTLLMQAGTGTIPWAQKKETQEGANTAAEKNCKQVLESLINQFKDEVVSNMQVFQNVLLNEGQYKENDNVRFKFQAQQRYHFYEHVELSPIGVVHWIKVKQPNGNAELEKKFEMLSHKILMNPESAAADDLAELVYLNSELPVIARFRPLSGPPDVFVIFPDADEIMGLLKVNYVNGGEYELTHTGKTVWKNAGQFKVGTDERIFAWLPLPSSCDDNDSPAAKALPTAGTNPVERKPVHMPEINKSLCQVPPRVNQCKQVSEHQIKRHALEGFDKPGYVFYCRSGEVKDKNEVKEKDELKEKDEVKIGAVLPLPEALRTKCRTFREGGNGIILEVSSGCYGFDMALAIKKTMFRWREVLIIPKLDHPNILKTHLMMMGQPREGFPRHRYVYHVYQKYQNDLGREIGSYERYCLRSMLERYKNETLVKTKLQGNYIKLFKQIAMALEYLHGINIIHRDIKPSNILVQRYRLCPCPNPVQCVCNTPSIYVLGDFDASLELASDGAMVADPPRNNVMQGFYVSTARTYHISPVGTIGFKSPEGSFYQVANDASLLPKQPCKMDIYGLGALAALMLYNEESAKYVIDWAGELLFANVVSRQGNLINLREMLLKNGVTLDGISKEHFELKNALFSSKDGKDKSEIKIGTHGLERSHQVQMKRFKTSSENWPNEAVRLAKYAATWVKADPDIRPTAAEVVERMNALDRGAGDASAPDDLVDTIIQPKHFVDSDLSLPESLPAWNNAPDAGLFQEYSLPPETELQEPIEESEPVRTKRLLSGDAETSSLKTEQRQKYLWSLKQKLDEYGLETHQSIGDGWCLLHSVAMQVNMSASELAERIIGRLKEKTHEEQNKIQEAIITSNNAVVQASLDQINFYNVMITEIENHQDHLGVELLGNVADITGIPVTLFMQQGANGELITLSFHPESGSAFNTHSIYIAHTGGSHFVPALAAENPQSNADFLYSLLPVSPLILSELPGYHEPFSNMNSLRKWIMDYTGFPLATTLISHMMAAQILSSNIGLKIVPK